MAPSLQLERDAASTRTDVEDATVHTSHCLALRGVPVSELAEVPGHRFGLDVAVFPLDYDPLVPALELSEQGASERVLLLAQH
jgi:hypothetical protein